MRLLWLGYMVVHYIPQPFVHKRVSILMMLDVKKFFLLNSYFSMAFIKKMHQILVAMFLPRTYEPPNVSVCCDYLIWNLHMHSLISWEWINSLSYSHPCWRSITLLIGLWVGMQVFKLMHLLQIFSLFKIKEKQFVSTNHFSMIINLDSCLYLEVSICLFWNIVIWDLFGWNGQEYLQGNPLWLQYIKTPLLTLGFETGYDVFVKAHGGGLSGQAQAISLGIARALLKVSENHRAPLRKEGLLTRDSRVVERKKVGLKKARKAPQYSKR